MTTSCFLNDNEKWERLATSSTFIRDFSPLVVDLLHSDIWYRATRQDTKRIKTTQLVSNTCTTLETLTSKQYVKCKFHHSFENPCLNINFTWNPLLSWWSWNPCTYSCPSTLLYGTILVIRISSTWKITRWIIRDFVRRYFKLLTTTFQTHLSASNF